MRFASVLLVLALFASSCYLPFLKKDAETVVREERGAVLQLTYAERSNCTAFHIGDGLFVSAAHCLMDQSAAPGQIKLTDKYGAEYYPDLIGLDLRRDLLLLRQRSYNGEKLELWDPAWDGEAPLGMDIMGLGYPAYFMLGFTFDLGQLRGTFQDASGVHFILARDLSSPGYSGGPIVSMRNGKVVGITHVMVDMTKYYNAQRHIGSWISIAVSVEELQIWLHELKLR